MPRNMSFMLTTRQVKNKTKTVTRRLGWWFLKPGEIVNAVEKCQGLKKGEKIKRICQIKIKHVRRERLSDLTLEDIKKEGLPGMSRWNFVEMFVKANKCRGGIHVEVNRIEFEYI